MKKLFSFMALAALAVPAFALTSGTIGEYTLTPEAGPVTEISSIKVDFIGTGFMGIDFPDADKVKAITLSDGTSTYYAAKHTYKGSSDIVLEFAPQGSSEVSTIMAPGTYTLSIPAGTFYEYFSTTKTNDLITAQYIVAGSEPAPASSPFRDPTVTPTPGGSYGSLRDFSITFPELEGGLEWPIADQSKITLSMQGDETIYRLNGPQAVGPDYKRLNFTFASPESSQFDPLTFTEAGLYTITFAEGALSEYQKAENVSPEMSFSFTVDPALNFTYSIEPDPAKCHESLKTISILPGSNMSDVIWADTQSKPVLSSASTSITLQASQSDGKLLLTIPDDVVIGATDWTLSIPAGALQGHSNSSDLMLTNAEPIEAVFKIRVPQPFVPVADPAGGSTLEIISKVTISFEKAPRQVAINEAAGTPTVSGGSLPTPATLTASIAGTSVELANSTELEDAAYTLFIPEGFIVTTDENGLTAPVPAITLEYVVKAPAVPDFAKGMFIINEGWFGHDAGSINFIPDEGPVYYNAFTLRNPSRSLGATTQSGQLFGNHLYAVSKMSPFLVDMDATTLTFNNELTEIVSGGAQPQAYAFCAVSADKGYLATSKGLFVVDLRKFEVTGQIKAPWLSSDVPFGQLLRYGSRVFAVSRLDDIIAIDIATDTPENVDAPTGVALTVSADGDIYCFTQNESSEIVRINPATLEATPIDIDADKAKIQDPWSAWREPSVAADIHDEVLYFALAGWSPSSVARYDVATGTYDPEFIRLPGKHSGLEADQILYGQGFSVDPVSGDIVVTAVEAGYGAHYQQNWIYYFDPATGELNPDKTVKLKEYYWFPAMTLWPGFQAPALELQPLRLSTLEPDAEIDLPALTTLPVGNKHLVNYVARSSDASVFTVHLAQDGTLTLSPKATGTATLTVEASYQGLTTRAQTAVDVNPSGIISADADAVRPNDVFTITGICLYRDATPEQIASLPAGIYVIAGKKTVIR